jgi:hypothetical protein
MSMTQRRNDLSASERFEAQSARMLLVRAAAQAETERRNAAFEDLVRANEPGRTLPRDDR